MKSKRVLFLRLLVALGLVAVVWGIGVSTVTQSLAFELLLVLVLGFACALLVVRLACRIVGTSFDATEEPLRGFVLFVGIAAGCVVAIELAAVLTKRVYGARDAFQAVMMMSFFLSLAFPLRGLFVSRTTASGKRVVYYLFSFFVTVLLSLMCVNTLGEYVDHRWFDLVTLLRGNRTVRNASVAVLELRTWPDEQKAVDLIVALQHTDVAAIVLPPEAFARGDDESFARLSGILPFEKLVFNIYGQKGKWSSVCQGASTIEAGFPPGNHLLTRSTGFPMFYQPWDTWCKDLALAAIQGSRILADTENLAPENLRIPFSEKKRSLINYYFLKPLREWDVIDELPFQVGLSSGGTPESGISQRYVHFRGEPVSRLNAEKQRFETYPIIKKQEGTIEYDVPDTTKPIPFIPGSLAGKILFINVPSNTNESLSEPSKSEAFLYATITENILRRDFLVEPRQLHQALAAMLLMGVVIALFLYLDPWKALGCSLLSFTVAAYVLFYLFAHANLIFGISWFAFGFVGITAFVFPYELVVDRSRALEERTRLRTELQAAREMQMGLMPSSDPVITGFDISGICIPAAEVGGDYFDYVWLDEQKTKLGIAVADVSGKAMKAAITAVMTSGMVYSEVGLNETPKGILRKFNRPIYLKTDRRIFTAMSFAVIDTTTKQMTFSNAGQMQPLLKRDGQIAALKVEGIRLPLGVVEDVEYREMTISLRSGDMVLYYTDGIPEAMNAKKEMFGFERLEAMVKENTAELPSKQLAAKIMDRVVEFAGSALRHDDMTVVVVRVL